MPREVTDGEGIRWSCAQAYAGLSQGVENGDAARVEGPEERYRVVCTPSGAAQSVALALPGGWEEELSDDDLLRAIQAERG